MNSERLPSKKNPEDFSLPDDAEIQFSTVRENPDATPFSLEDLMEDSGIVLKDFENLGGWKLDSRIAALCQKKDSQEFKELQHLVTLIDAYNELLGDVELTAAEYAEYHQQKLLYQALCLLPTVLVTFVALNRGLEYSWLLAGVTSLLSITLMRIRTIQIEIGKRVIINQETWRQLDAEASELADIGDDITKVLDEIDTSFRKLKLSWYSRDNVFHEALEHIETVYLNSTLSD